MSTQRRPKGEDRSAQHEGSSVSTPGRPKGEDRSAQHEGSSVTPPGRPKGEYRSAQHEGAGVTALFDTRPLAPGLGAEVLGVSLAGGVSDALFEGIYPA